MCLGARVANGRIPKKPHQFYKKWYRETFCQLVASYWSKYSTISFKFYVQTPFFSIFITPHLCKCHIRTVNRHSGPDVTKRLFYNIMENRKCRLNFFLFSIPWAVMLKVNSDVTLIIYLTFCHHLLVNMFIYISYNSAWQPGTLFEP